MKSGIAATIASAAFSLMGVYFYLHAEYARANYWMITTLIVEVVLMRLSRY